MSQVFKKLRFLVRLTFAFLKKRFFFILAGIFLGILFFNLSPLIVSLLPKPRRVEKIGVVGKYQVNELPSEILKKISIGLTKNTSEGKFEPDLADSWEFSPDGKIYTFYFGNKNFYWHDGTKFKVEDINYNFKDAKILKINFNIVKIILEEPFSPLPAIVSRPIFKKGLVGLGEYKVKKIEKVGNYIKSISLIPVDKNKETSSIIYRFYPNESQLKIAFFLGEINKIEDLENSEEFKDLKNVKISSYQKKDRYVALFFKVDHSPFDDKNFRQAIAYAIKKRSDKTRALGPIGPWSWVYNPGVKKYERDIAKAKLLLSKVKIDSKEPLVIYTFPSLEDEAKDIQEDLKEINLNTEVRVVNILPENFDMLLAIQKIPADPDQYTLWHTGQENNFIHFSNLRIDKLLEDGRKTYKEEERKKIYFDFQRFLVEESPAVFLYYPTYFLIERN